MVFLYSFNSIRENGLKESPYEHLSLIEEPIAKAVLKQ